MSARDRHYETDMSEDDDDDSDAGIPISMGVVVPHVRTLVPTSQLEHRNEPIAQGIRVSGGVNAEMDLFDFDLDDPLLQQGGGRQVTVEMQPSSGENDTPQDEKKSNNDDDDETSNDKNDENNDDDGTNDQVRIDTDSSSTSSSSAKSRDQSATVPEETRTPLVSTRQAEIESPSRSDDQVQIDDDDDDDISKSTLNTQESLSQKAAKSWNKSSSSNSEKQPQSPADANNSIEPKNANHANPVALGTEPMQINDANNDDSANNEPINARIHETSEADSVQPMEIVSTELVPSQPMEIVSSSMPQPYEMEQDDDDDDDDDDDSSDGEVPPIAPTSMPRWQQEPEGELLPREESSLAQVDEDWERHYRLVRDYLKDGPDYIPNSLCMGKAKVGEWADDQRKTLQFGKSTDADHQSKITRLDSIGFLWRPCISESSKKRNTSQYDFNKWMRLLREHMEKQGSGWIPSTLKVGDAKLGQWTSNQRLHLNKGVKSDSMTEASKSRIDTMTSHGFLWTAPAKKPWDFWVGLLRNYVKKEGNLFIPLDTVFDGFSIGEWADMIRRLYCHGDKNKLLTEEGKAKVDELNKAGFVWIEGYAATGNNSETRHSRVFDVNSGRNESVSSQCSPRQVEHSGKKHLDQLRSIDHKAVVSSTHDEGLNADHFSTAEDRASGDKSLQKAEKSRRGIKRDRTVHIKDELLDFHNMIDQAILKAEHGDLMKSLHNAILKAESTDLLQSIDRRILKAEAHESHVVDSTSSQKTSVLQPRRWMDPSVWVEGPHRIKVVDYTDSGTGFSSSDLVPKKEIVTPPVAANYLGVESSSVVELRRTFRLRRLIGNRKCVTPEIFKVKFVEPFNERYETNLKYFLGRVGDDASKWGVIAYGDQKMLSNFAHSLERWESLCFEDPSASLSDLVKIHDDGDDSSNDSNNEAKNSPGEAKEAAHIHFERKFKKTIRTEFRGDGIHSKTAVGSMWRRHKEKFGDCCSEECGCVFDLPYLTSQVVAEFLAKKNEKKQSIDPTGFAQVFAPKFLPKLKKQYPGESPHQLLGRLEIMWDSHRRTRGMGFSCKANCECEQGWEDVFNVGRPVSKNSGKRSSASVSSDNEIRKRRNLTTSSCLVESSTVSADNPILDFRVPKKSKSVPETIRTETRQEGPSLLDTRIPKKAKERKQESELSYRKEAGRKEYTVEFPIGSPLGYYFNDIRDITGQTSCMVTSVSPSGSEDRDSRIQCGTTVVAVVHEKQKKAVTSFLDLQAYYNAFQDDKERDSFQLVLVNNNVARQGLSDEQATRLEKRERHNEDWCADGKWRGSRRDGWAGGARQIAQYKPNHGNIPKNASADSSTNQTGEARKFSPEHEQGRHEESTNSDDESSPWKKIDFPVKTLARRQITLKPILRQTDSTDGIFNCNISKRVSFGEKERMRKFCKTDPSTGFFVRSRSPDFSACHSFHTSESSRKAAEETAMRELWDVFQLRDLRRIVDSFNRHGTKRFSLEMCQKVRGSLPRQGNEEKHNFLKFFINSAHVGLQAKHIQDWRTLDVEVDRIDSMRFSTSEIKNLSLKVVWAKPDTAKHEGGTGETVLLEMPVDGAESSSTFARELKTFHSNPKATPERALKFYLMLDDQKIGEAKVMLNMIHDTCVGAGAVQNFSVPLEGIASPFEKAQVHYRVRHRTDLSQEAIYEKQRSWKLKLAEYIDTYLKGWNRNSGEKLNARLNPDAVSVGGTSLVESAIYLWSWTAAETLSVHGADLGRVVDLASRLREKVACDFHADDTNEFLKKRLERFDEIVSKLRKWHPLKDSATAAADAGSAEDESSASQTEVLRLPSLQNDWCEVQSKHRCFATDKGKRCAYGRDCDFVHVQQPWGSSFDQHYNSIPEADKKLPITVQDFQDCVVLKDEGASDGRFWWTAGYRKVVGKKFKGQRIIYAEGSHAARNESGVCWFPDREDAKEALVRAITLSYWAEKNGLLSSSPSAQSDGHFRKKDHSQRAHHEQISPRNPNIKKKQHDNGTPLHLERTLSNNHEVPGARRRSDTSFDSVVSSHSGDSKHSSPRFQNTGFQKHGGSPTNHRDSGYYGMTVANPIQRVDPYSLDRSWLEQRFSKNKAACKYFKYPGGCARNASCKFAHLRHPVAHLLPQHRTLANDVDPSLVHYVMGQDSRGGMWYTAGYKDERNGEIYAPEQLGGYVLASTSGVWWYRSTGEAFEALVAVVATWRHTPIHR